MAWRMNGKTFRSGEDIQILMESNDNREQPPAEEIERRIALYSLRFDNGLSIFTGERLTPEELAVE